MFYIGLAMFVLGLSHDMTLTWATGFYLIIGNAWTVKSEK